MTIKIRYFEYVTEKSSKFWEISVIENSVNVRYGKIGVDGQSQAKQFSDRAKANKYAEKLVHEKLEKGYCEPSGAVDAVIPKKKKKSNPLGTSDIAVSRTKRVVAQMKKATDIKQQIISATQNLFPDGLISYDSEEDIATLYRQLELSAESFEIVFSTLPPTDVDRTVSMLSGPFFTSLEYPIPTNGREMLYPIVQLDLNMASAVIGENLGDGLLQLWYDTNLFDGVVRVIPRPAVKTQELTAFDLVPSIGFDGFPLPSDWKSDPLGTVVRVFSGLTSTGISCQTGPNRPLFSHDWNVPNEFRKLNDSFAKCSTHKEVSSIHLFGTTTDYAILFAQANAGKKCLFNIHGDWGNSGWRECNPCNAHVLYELKDDGCVAFEFKNDVNLLLRKKILLAAARSLRPKPIVAAFKASDKIRPKSEVDPMAAVFLENVSHSKSVIQQIEKATALKQQVIWETKTLFPYILESESDDSDERRFLRQIESSAESFDVKFQLCDPLTVDRTSSMLSGPFFTSKKFPIPIGNKEMLYPIVQVDLRIASALIGEPLGDGLLQLWYDISAFKGSMRVIPRSELTLENTTDFGYVIPKKFDGYPLPDDWGSNPTGDVVKVMSKYKSTGISTQSEYPEIYLNDASQENEVPEEMFALVARFNKLACDKSSSAVHMFGTFNPIQYSAADVGKKCLFHIAGDWGSSGNAQVFYDIGETGDVSFFFWDSVR